MKLENVAMKPFINYPLRFKPIILEKIWGGKKLHSLLGKEVGDITCAGESWEISAVEGSLSIISNGIYKGLNIEQILTQYGSEILGIDHFKQFGTRFPLLIKFLDSTHDLSIQVHPNDKIALERHHSLGKTEFWYVIDAETDSRIISGFNRAISKEEYLKRLSDHTLEEVLDSIVSKPKSSFFIPSGRIHALGAGNVVAEIQQTSDITYRIFDYNRVDNTGKTRELHTDLALDCINFSVDRTLNKQITPNPNETECIISCNNFTANIDCIENEKAFNLFDRKGFTIIMCVDGAGSINYDGISECIKKGDTLLLPAQFNRFSISAIESPLEILEVFI